MKYKNRESLEYGNQGLKKTFVTATCPRCEKEFKVLLSYIKNGHTKSCGCLRGENHKEGKTRLYNIWQNMKKRCQKTTDHAYKNYGNRGIKVCNEWSSYLTFKEWSIKNGYKENLTIERINNDGNYEPLNCRWATYKEQGRNTRSNVNYKKECAFDASVRLGGNRHLVASRIDLGWSKKRAFTTPIS